ncbi:MAG: EAL domain-containing protein [Defluviimonas sp.]|uniref:EAL domain-containing protein n=1 Tax=Albidovulum sp. TaxID=1872424 RepID=UPI001DD1B8FB|nr:EAL domain-containing protein [Paracoccaceae bacterium]MCC0063194.1 EAL domain-containing protein [Defluviimonas sp.]
MAGKQRSYHDAPDPSDESPLSVAVTARDRDVMTMVRRAIERNDVMLAYQPVMQMAAQDRPAFYEGFVRLVDETGRVIPAGQFMPTVETQEIGRVIDCLALDMGFNALRHDPALRLSLNMSARSIAYPRWTRLMRRGLAADPTAGERLILEISEASAMVMPDVVSVFMRQLQPAGVAFALDDFGSGLTSFRHLRDFYFDLVKIDGSFIRGIADTADNQCLVAALIGIARQFDMLVVAESVETAADADWLARAGVDCLQGYFYGAPTATPPWAVPETRIAV